MNIAQGVIHLLPWPLLGPPFDVARLGEIAVAMLDDSLKRSWNRTQPGPAVLRRDDEADSLQMASSGPPYPHDVGPGVIERALGLILVSLCLERIADHATNIAEEVIFAVEGRVVRHGDGSSSRAVPQ